MSQRDIDKHYAPIPGLASRVAAEGLESKKTNFSDTIKRTEIKEQIIQRVKEGMSVDKAIESVITEEVKESFEYLVHLDLKTVFYNWVKRDLDKLESLPSQRPIIDEDAKQKTSQRRKEDDDGR